MPNRNATLTPTLTPKTLPRSLRVKPPGPSPIPDWDPQDGDRLEFGDDGHVEIVRGIQRWGKWRYSEGDGEPLGKAIQRTQLGLVPGTEKKIAGPNVTSMPVEGMPPPAPSSDPAPKSSPKKSAPPESPPVGTKPKSSDIPPGARWITVHPGGEGSKGVPILIKPHPDGSASVIGGAGGKLNYLKLNKLRSPEEWKARAAERKAARAERERKRVEAQTPEQQAEEAQQIEKAKEHHLSERHKNALQTVEVLQEAGIELGLTEGQIDALKAPPPPEADEATVKEWQRSTREAVKAVQQVQRAYEHKLVTDHEARAAARLGDESLEGLGNDLIQGRDHTAIAGETEISTIKQLPDGRWLVASADDAPDQVYDKWEAAAKRHAANVAEYDSTNGGDPSQSDSFYDPTQWVREPPSERLPEGFEFKAEVAAKMAQLAAARKEIDKGEKNAFEAIKKGTPYREQGYETFGVGEVSHDALDKLEQDAETLRDAIANDGLLSLVDQVDPEGLRSHLTFAGYAKLGEIASDVLKVNPLDRVLVDALGHNEAAKLLAYQIKESIPPSEYDLVVAAQAKHHAEFSRKLTEETMAQAEPIMAELREVHERMVMLESERGGGGGDDAPVELDLFGNPVGGDDGAIAGAGDGEYTPQQQIELDNLTYQSRTLHAAVQKLLGGAIGQLQASAAMTAALEAAPRSLVFRPKTSVKEAGELVPSQWGDRPSDFSGRPSAFDAYSLNPEDLEVDDGPDGQIVTVKESGLKKILEQSYDPSDREAYEQAIAIKRGDMDEDDFTPNGFAYRPKHTFSDPAQDAEKFDTRFNYSPEMPPEQVKESLLAYLGSRVANGDDPVKVRNDLFAPGTYQSMGLDQDAQIRISGVVDALDRELFQNDPDAKVRKVAKADIRQKYQELGDREAARQNKSRKTSDREALNSQRLDRDSAVEAAHRTLAAMPMARAAFKSWDKLTAAERRYMREYAITKIMKEELMSASSESDEETDGGGGEAIEEMDLFGNVTVLTGAQSKAIAQISAKLSRLDDSLKANSITKDEYDRQSLELREQEAQVRSGQLDPESVTTQKVTGSVQWKNFSRLVGGDAKAYEIVRDKLRGEFVSRFTGAYGAISGEPPLRGGKEFAHLDRLLVASLPEDKRQEMLDHIRRRKQSELAGARARSGGKFAVESEDLLEKFNQLKGGSNQISLLSTEQETSGMDSEAWQRVTLGDAAESDLQDVLGDVIPNFEQISSSVGIIPEVRWSGNFAAHQRGLKLLETQKKIGAHFSAGAGKSALMLGSYSHLQSQGKAKKMWVCVPSSIVGQFVGEAATFLEPGKFNYNANLGWNREQRLGALTDPEGHIHITTRESMANDLLHLVEKHTGVSPEDFQDTTARSEDDRRELMGKALRSEGIDPKELLFAVDEAHDIARRKGVGASKRSLALDALAYHSGHYIHATGTPLKNDLSEIHDFLCKVAPDKYKSEDQGAFLKKYGRDNKASQRALQRILAPYTYAVAIKPEDGQGGELQMTHNKPRIGLSEHQASERSRILEDYKTVQSWYNRELRAVTAKIKESGEDRLPTRADFAHAWDDPAVRDAVGRLASPDTHNTMTPEQQQAAIGGRVMAAAAMKSTAMSRLYHRTDFAQNTKAQHLVDTVAAKVEAGKPSVVFSASSQAAEMLRDEMGKRGLRVGYIHGGLSAEQKSAERLKFSPAKGGGEPEYDVLLCTDAAQTGLNLQRGKYLAHYDIPLTQKAWDQRSARIYRRGQTENVEVDTLLSDSPEEEIALARMERKAEASRVFQGHNQWLGQAEVLDDSGLAGAIARLRAESQN